MSPSRTRVLPVALGLAVSAVLLWTSSRLVWLDVTATNDQSGDATRTLGGATWQPAMVPLALASLAAIAAVALARGLAARIVGAVLVVLGLAAVVPALGAFREIDRERVHAVVTAPEDGGTTTSGSGKGGATAVPEWSRITEVRDHPVGPSLTALAAVVLVCSGFALVVRPPPRLGSDERFSAPSRAPTAARHEGDPERGMWDSLDAGSDPTA